MKELIVKKVNRREVHDLPNYILKVVLEGIESGDVNISIPTDEEINKMRHYLSTKISSRIEELNNAVSESFKSIAKVAKDQVAEIYNMHEFNAIIYNYEKEGQCKKIDNAYIENLAKGINEKDYSLLNNDPIMKSKYKEVLKKRFYINNDPKINIDIRSYMDLSIRSICTIVYAENLVR